MLRREISSAVHVSSSEGNFVHRNRARMKAIHNTSVSLHVSSSEGNFVWETRKCMLNPELGCQLAFDLFTGELISVS